MTKGRSRFEYICTVCMYTYVHCCCKMVQWAPRSLGWRSLATSAIGQRARKQAQKCMLSSSCLQFEFAASLLNEYIKIIRGRFLHTTLMPDDEWTKMYKDLKRRISKAKRMAKTMQQQQQQQPQLRQSQTRERDSEIERELKLASVCWPWNHHSYPFHLPSPIVSANHLQTRVIKPKVFFTAANGSVCSNLSSWDSRSALPSLLLQKRCISVWNVVRPATLTLLRPSLTPSFLGQQRRRRPSLYQDRRNMSKKSKKKVAALAAFADLLLLQTRTHTHPRAGAAHVAREFKCEQL